VEISEVRLGEFARTSGSLIFILTLGISISFLFSTPLLTFTDSAIGFLNNFIIFDSEYYSIYCDNVTTLKISYLYQTTHNASFWN